MEAPVQKKHSQERGEEPPGSHHISPPKTSLVLLSAPTQPTLFNTLAVTPTPTASATTAGVHEHRGQVCGDLLVQLFPQILLLTEAQVHEGLCLVTHPKKLHEGILIVALHQCVHLRLTQRVGLEKRGVHEGLFFRVLGLGTPF